MTNHFTAKRVTRTATIYLNGAIEKVYPLFGAFEERKWAEGWAPVLIYPASAIIEEGTTFITPASNPDEKEFLWRVSKYEPAQYLVQYLVSTVNRYWTITVQCVATSPTTTSATITYTYIGLCELGNALNEAAIKVMYATELKDWEEAINYYLAHGVVKQ